MNVDVPAFELGEPAARSDFGLEQADVALGQGRSSVSTSSSAARSDATRKRNEVAAQRRAGDGSQPMKPSRSRARSCVALSLSHAGARCGPRYAGVAERARGLRARLGFRRATGLATCSKVVRGRARQLGR